MFDITKYKHSIELGDQKIDTNLCIIQKYFVSIKIIELQYPTIKCQVGFP